MKSKKNEGSTFVLELPILTIKEVHDVAVENIEVENNLYQFKTVDQKKILLAQKLKTNDQC